MIFPELGYKPDTQRGRVYEMLKTGPKCGRDFLRLVPGIPEFRSRVNQIDKDLREYGFFIKHFWDKDRDEKFIFFEIREATLFEVDV